MSTRELDVDFTGPDGPALKKPTVYDKQLVPRGWWAENVPPTANAVEILAIVQRLKPDHRGMPRLVRNAKMFQRVRGADDQAFYRCKSCNDAGWVETESDGRGTFARCSGPMGSGCLR